MVLERLIVSIIHFRLILILLSNMLGNFRNISEDLLLICIWEGVLMEKSLCQVCSRSDEQIKVILHFVRKRLLRISQEYIPDYRDQCDSSPKQTHAFGRLLSIIMGSTTHLPSFHACPHEKFSRYLRRKLKCDNTAFHSLCNELIQKIAERNYQLEVLTTQLKNLSDTCLSLSSRPEAELVRSLDEQKQEVAQQTFASFPSEQREMRVGEPAFLQPVYNQFGNSFAQMSVLYVSLGMSPQEMESQPFQRNNTN